MEVSCVVISKSAVPDFCSLSPVSGLKRIETTKGSFSEGPKTNFKRSQGEVFLENVDKVDDGSTISQVDGGEMSRMGPSAGSSPNPFEAKAKLANGGEVFVSSHNTVPVDVRKGDGSLMREPDVIQPKNGTAGHSRGGFKMKRDMIRHGPDRGGEGGVW